MDLSKLSATPTPMFLDGQRSRASICLDYRAIESAANRRGIVYETCSTQRIVNIIALDFVLIIIVMQFARMASAEVRSPLRARGATGAGARSSLRAGDMAGGAAGAPR